MTVSDARALLFLAVAWYDWERDEDNPEASWRARVTLGNTVLWESKERFVDEDRAREAAEGHLAARLRGLLDSG